MHISRHQRDFLVLALMLLSPRLPPRFRAEAARGICRKPQPDAVEWQTSLQYPY